MMVSHKDDVSISDLDFGRKLKILRRRKGMSRKEFARLLDISYVSLTQWEKGRGVKTFTKFLNMCKKLKVTPHHFID